VVRRQSGIQNLTIDYSTDTNGRILSAAYTETGGFTGNFTYVYDNYGNIIACKLDYGDMAKAVLINPNNGAIDTRYDPNDIYDPFSYRARDGFMGIGPLWANNDDGTVYMQGHLVIPNPWGNVSTNGTTTTTTDDTTDKDGGDDAETCGTGGCAGNCVDYDNMNCDQIKREIEKGNCKPCGSGGDACRKLKSCSKAVDDIKKDGCCQSPAREECYNKYGYTGMVARALGPLTYYDNAKKAFKDGYYKIGCSPI